MKKAIIVLLVCLLAGWSFAQTEANAMRDKDLGVLFSFRGLSNLGVGAYDGMEGAVGIGAKMYQGSKAFRATLVFGSTSSSDESSIENYIGEENSFSAFGVGVDYLLHLNNAKISPYAGAGVGYFSGKIKSEEAHMQGSGYSIVEEKASQFFVRGIFGLEIFIKKNISLSGEYLLPYTKTTETVTSESQSSDGSSTASIQSLSADKSEATTKSSSFGFSAAAHLTLSIYFNDALF